MPVKNFYPLTILVVLATLFIVGCRKDDWKQKTKMELLTAAPWNFSQAGLDTNNDGKIDSTIRPDLLPECVFDNKYTFHADGTAILDEDNNNCNGSDPRQTSFTWYFMNQETEIFMSLRLLPVYESPSRIVELTHKKFVLTRQVGVHGYPTPLTFVIVLSR